MKRLMWFGGKGKLSRRYVKLYEILYGVREVAYEFALPTKLDSLNTVFNVSMLNKCLGDPASTLPIEGLGVVENLSFKEVPVKI